MFIKSSVNTTIKDKDVKFHIPNNYIGPVPEWVEKNWYFQSLCKSGSITFVDSSIKDSQLEKVDEIEKAKQRKLAEEAQAKRELDEKINDITKNAEEKAIEQGLDEVSKKNFVKQEVEKELNKAKKKNS